MRRHRASAALAALTTTLVVIALVQVGPARAATVTVTVADNVFQPASVSPVAGDTVVWTQPGARVHTVTADDGSFDSGNLAAGQTFSRVFSTPGTFRYYCKIHGAPGGIGMSGVITVTAAQVTTTTTTTVATTTTTAAPATTTTTAAAATADTTTTTAAPQVLSASAESQPSALASTGLPAGYLAALGLALILAGFVFVTEAKRE